MRAPYWSDQKYGTGVGVAGSPAPRRVAAAVAGCSSALVQCSMRTCRSAEADHVAAQSPTATTPGMFVAPRVSVRTPLPRATPEWASHSMLGVAPMPTTTTSAGRRVPSVSSTASTLPVPTSPATPVPVSKTGAVVGVQLGTDRAHVGAQRAGERDGLGLDDGDVESERAGRGGDLCPDEPGADHDEAFGDGQVLPQGDRVVQGAQHVHAGESLAAGQPPGPGARGEDDATGPDPATALQQDRAAEVVEADR